MYMFVDNILLRKTHFFHHIDRYIYSNAPETLDYK